MTAKSRSHLTDFSRPKCIWIGKNHGPSDKASIHWDLRRTVNDPLRMPLVLVVEPAPNNPHRQRKQPPAVAVRKLPNHFLEVVPPKGRRPPLSRRVWLGACALRLLPYLVVYVLGLRWLRSKMNDFEPSSTTGFYFQLTTILFLEIPGNMLD